MSALKGSKYSYGKREKKHFLELAFENKMKNMQEQVMPSGTQAMHTIGSIHNKKVNYDVDECFFAKDDIALDIRDKHNEVLEFTDPDFLGMRKKEWNTSVSVPTNALAEQDHQRKLLNIRIGLENHPILKLKDKQIEEGCDTRNDYSGWKTTTLFDRRECRRNLNEQDYKSTIMTANYRNRYLGSEYMNPEVATNKMNELLRGEKLVNENEQNELRTIYKHLNPETSAAKLEGAVFKMNYEKKLKERQKEFLAKLDEEEKNKNLVTKEILRSKTSEMGLGDDEEEDYSKKIDTIMRTIQETKKNREKGKKLHWVYEGI